MWKMCSSPDHTICIAKSQGKAYKLDVPTANGWFRLQLMKTWYEKARGLMLEKNISIRELADSLGMTPGGTGHYLSGRRHPKPGMLKKIAKQIGVSVSELIEDDPAFARDDFEQEALESLRNVPVEHKQAALAMLKSLIFQPTPPQSAPQDHKQSC